MSRYVMSDIHGCYTEFIEMLQKINFGDDDELYVLGDIFDRGPQPLKVLDYILDRKNIHMIKGNHEKMFEDALINDDYMLWYVNGGYVTHSQLLERGETEIAKVLEYVKGLPLIKVVDKFIFVHAGFKDYDDSFELEEFLTQSEDIYVWSRENIGNEKKYRDYTIICGHTPVQNIEDGSNTIIKRHGTIYIDCGCCFGQNVDGQLACLRLEDMQEYYVSKICVE
jgi:serine/threonine protein phosphatase 1